MPLAMQEPKHPPLNPAIERLVTAAGSQNQLAKRITEKKEARGGVGRVYQSHIWTALYKLGYMPETMLMAALDVAEDLGLDDITMQDLRPSIPRR